MRFWRIGGSYLCVGEELMGVSEALSESGVILGTRLKGDANIILGAVFDYNIQTDKLRFFWLSIRHLCILYKETTVFW